MLENFALILAEKQSFRFYAFLLNQKLYIFKASEPANLPF
ncbi:hypothetical protein DB41_AE00260 [Neochlamydia sp. TUME1]|nr:hypothetical protein DB41_AE00260 [Neochlamydia sp. TUME1]